VKMFDDLDKYNLDVHNTISDDNNNDYTNFSP